MANKDLNNYEELDLRIFLRNKKFITSISLIRFIIACIYSLFLKRVWEGEFQIVLENNDKELNLPFNLNASFLNDQLGKKANGLSTEVGILKSPSVLMPTFDFVLAAKKEVKPELELIFTKWKDKNLKIELEQGTSILNISYRDTNKKLVVPVLQKISSSYQDYSGRRKRKNTELSKNFLKIKFLNLKLKALIL